MERAGQLGKGGGMERPGRGERGRSAGTKPAAANSNNAQKTRHLPTKLFLTFQLEGAATTARLKIWSILAFFSSNKTLVNNKWTLQRPIVQLGTTLDSESHSSENWPNEYRGRSQQRGPERESGFILDHTKKYAVFPYARWAQIRFNIVFSHWYPP